MRRILRAAGWVFAGLLGVAGVLLLNAHFRIRQERAPLPPAADLLAAIRVNGRPTRLTWINTASQPMPRGGVLDPSVDPNPSAPYVMSHPSFVLEWADGRLLLVDLGMTDAGARSFGRIIEWGAGGAAIEPHTTVPAALGSAAERVRGVIFSHLHDDHVGGLEALCQQIKGPIPVFMTAAQVDRGNYTTRAGRALIRQSTCVRETRLEGSGILAVEGFPGVVVLDVGGHTPGSQAIVAAVGTQVFAFVGDTVNHIDGVRHDLPKPYLYSLLMVPEDRERLGELRRFFRSLSDDDHVTILPAHDELWLRTSGIPTW